MGHLRRTKDRRPESPKRREIPGHSQEEAAQWEQENFPFTLQSMPCLPWPLCLSGEWCANSLPSVPAPCCSLWTAILTSLTSSELRLGNTFLEKHFYPHRVIHPSRLWSSGPALQVHTVWFIRLYICFRPCPLGSEH